jgi:predicted PolB exonuclease-like 3'-5' exonuclease
MADPNRSVAWLVFDVEAVADKDLVSRIRYPKDDLPGEVALRRYRDELIEQTGKDVLPPSFVLPVSVAVAKVDARFRLLDLAVLDAPAYRPHEIVRRFWSGWAHYGRPTLVSFNGRGYDLPVLELAAFRYGLPLPEWFNVEARSFEQSRNRYNQQAHVDLMDVLTNFGAFRLSGGLNLLANLIGKPGKTGLDGSLVQDYADAGRLEEINDYCRCDVLDTYFVFLRTQVLIGRLSLSEEQERVAEAHDWIAGQADRSPAFAHYLEHWGDWHPPGA